MAVASFGTPVKLPHDAAYSHEFCWSDEGMPCLMIHSVRLSRDPMMRVIHAHFVGVTRACHGC